MSKEQCADAANAGRSGGANQQGGPINIRDERAPAMTPNSAQLADVLPAGQAKGSR